MTAILERPDGPEARTERVRVFDGGESVGGGGGELQIPNTLTIPSASRASVILELSGFRWFRFKWRITDDVGGISTTSLTLVDINFARFGTAFEFVVIGPFPFGANGANVQNFGEGTGVLKCFMGPFFRLLIRNNGPGNIRIRDCELWAGS